MPTPTEGGDVDPADASPDDGPIRVAFVCVQNAGRSQMAYAFAEREVRERGIDGRVETLTGGTTPADHVHPEVVDAMRAVGIDLSGRTPRGITTDELADSAYVVTMGCSADGICPATWVGESRDWALDDPDGQPPERVAAIRDEIRDRVAALFDELETRVE